MNFANLVPPPVGPIEVVAAVLAVLILASSLDDLFIDACYWLRRLVQLPERSDRTRGPSLSDLEDCAERPIAIMVPAWQEADVIAAMLENTLRTVDYGDYRIFVGTYPNDPATAREVDRMVQRDARIHRVQLPHPGPTCKADCLNHIVEDVLDHEAFTGRTFAAMVLHDAEDVLHPLELRYFNAALSHCHMIQLPVVALQRLWHELVAGTYMDEFAEAHGKDMLVRQHLCGNVPSAGVGTCLSRAAILALRKDLDGDAFRTDSLTEDYEVGMRLSRLGLSARFDLISFEHPAATRTLPARRGTPAAEEALLSVREYFPQTFRAAYRQRARWMVGICLQAWQQVPLRGQPWSLVYLMLHDRKSVVTSFVPMAAYLVLACAVVQAWGASEGWWAAPAPVLFTDGSVWQLLLYANGVLLLVRAVQRFYFTGTVYGPLQGVLALPRLLVGNFVNFMAAARAWRLYLVHRATGRALAWDKTAHQYPQVVKPQFVPLPADGIPTPVRIAAQPAPRPVLRPRAEVPLPQRERAVAAGEPRPQRAPSRT